MKKEFIIDEKILEKVKDLSLFYPCSGDDLLVPIELFSPYITDFWFVDKSYFTNSRASKIFNDSTGSDASIQLALLYEDSRYELLSTHIEGMPVWNCKYKNIKPCILTETYKHLSTERIIRIHRRRGYGFSALRFEKRMGKLGVFFYRGDAPRASRRSESVGWARSGSGNLWLKPEHLCEVFNKLIEGGLLVLDGSHGAPYFSRKGIHKELCKYWYKYDCDRLKMTPREYIDGVNDFLDKKQRQYHCVGYAGEIYRGPTMIWQVNNISQEEGARVVALQPNTFDFFLLDEEMLRRIHPEGMGILLVDEIERVVNRKHIELLRTIAPQKVNTLILRYLFIRVKLFGLMLYLIPSLLYTPTSFFYRQVFHDIVYDYKIQYHYLHLLWETSKNSEFLPDFI